MVWSVSLRASAEKQLERLDKPVQRRIYDFLQTRIATAEDPRRIGKAGEGPLSEYWLYRIGDFRLICEVLDRRRLVDVLKIGNRREVYR